MFGQVAFFESAPLACRFFFFLFIPILFQEKGHSKVGERKKGNKNFCNKAIEDFDILNVAGFTVELEWKKLHVSGVVGDVEKDTPDFLSKVSHFQKFDLAVVFFGPSNFGPGKRTLQSCRKDKRTHTPRIGPRNSTWVFFIADEYSIRRKKMILAPSRGRARENAPSSGNS